MEQYWIDMYAGNLYNKRLVASSNSGLTHTKDIKEAQSLRAKQYWVDRKDEASQYAKDRWNDPDCRRRMIEGNLKYKDFTLVHKDGRTYNGKSIRASAEELGVPEAQLRLLFTSKANLCKGWSLVSN
jgi:hypothetical protein